MDIKIVHDFLRYQPEIKVADTDGDKIVLEGKIFVNMIYDNFPVQQFFDIKIVVNTDNVYLSTVYETGGHIKDYHHKYVDDRLCLATNVDLLLSNCTDNSLVNFCQNYIEPYLFSYEYYVEYGFFPYGEREHDVKGILASYREITGIYDELEIVKFLLDLLKGSYVYRGHLPCHCGSEKKARNCHPKIRLLIQNELISRLVVNDCRTILEEINERKGKTKRTTNS